ncbi:hypothetical protein EVAR_20883_1 [Eumeta japonica]|uniref:Uncharacterized protein n=1 Tax=Eumeta variegata TaxID=151549 RepID=A0A4C1UVB2_EUMVA|nr:hypothetical protein EVAR_20883_1 [Eumeta japonica]
MRLSRVSQDEIFNTVQAKHFDVGDSHDTAVVVIDDGKLGDRPGRLLHKSDHLSRNFGLLTTKYTYQYIKDKGVANIYFAQSLSAIVMGAVKGASL